MEMADKLFSLKEKAELLTPKLSDSTIEASKIVIPAEAGIQIISQEPGFLFSQE
jgi:hypothetical protein